MLKKIRQKFQKWRLASENKTYAQKYKRRFGDLPPFDSFLIKENKFSGRQLGIIYLTQYDSTFSTNNAYLPLCELGTVYRHEMDEKDDRKNWYKVKKDKNIEMVNFVKQTIMNHKIDVIVCYHSGRTLTQGSLEFLASLNIPVINESLDDERKFVGKKGGDGIYRGMKEICKYVTLSLTTSKSALVKYLVEGGKALYKPYAANPNVYKKLWLDKKYDVVFVGANYGTRPMYIDYLRQNGINVLAKGDGWENGSASADEMIELFNQAKIILGFAGVGISDDIFILKGRDFEAPLTGSMYMTQRHEELTEYFELGRDIETYASKEELLQKVRRYLEDDEAREKIARNGYEKCQANYTTKASYEKIFGHLGL